MFIPTAGRRITHRAIRRGGLTIAVLGCAVALAACTTPSAANSAGAAPSTSTSPTAQSPTTTLPTTTLPTTPAPRPSATTPTSTQSPTTGTTAVRQTPTCASRDFSAAPVTGEGAAGSEYFTVTITNHGATCYLAGRPILRYTRGNGDVATIPFASTNSGSKPRSVLVRHGRSVSMTIRTPDGYGGWSPSSPQCAHPVSYRGISVVVSNGRVALPNFGLDVKCEGVTLWSYWSATS